MSLIQQWANNVGANNTKNGSWILAIANVIGADIDNSNILESIRAKYGESQNTGDTYRDIAINISSNKNVKPLNGSYLARIVELTTP